MSRYSNDDVCEMLGWVIVGQIAIVLVLLLILWRVW
jgi:hypothetical protein